jgi:hypothetical protein
MEACAYCGGSPDTVDHVPSRILLDDPLPANLPVVPACTTCNRGFSRDEEYLACFLECVLAGTIEADRLRRPKVQAALRHSPKLASQIGASGHATADGAVVWTPDIARVQNVVVKLARGHALYELCSPAPEAPEFVSCNPLIAMSAEDRAEFESGSGLRGWPEIGSRAFLRAAGVTPYANRACEWVEVQRCRYRYSVEDGSVRMVLAEYLACAVGWA